MVGSSGGAVSEGEASWKEGEEVSMPVFEEVTIFREVSTYFGLLYFNITNK